MSRPLQRFVPVADVQQICVLPLRLLVQQLCACAIQKKMYLYHLTLQQPTAISQCIAGNFLGEKLQEVLVIKGNSLVEICRPNPETGALEVLFRQEAFCKIRSCALFRLGGMTKDLILLGSDSGRIIILEYKVSPTTGPYFERIHLETFGKSGTRRIVPGQFLGVDPKGRALMLGAIEKNKLVYVLNRDSEGSVTISSPLEAHKSKIITCQIVGVDVSFQNPIFAALELDYSLCEEEENENCHEKLAKFLTFYELDLGLNHVVRKWNTPVELSANLLIALPGSDVDCPGGVLVCSQDRITWMNASKDPIAIAIPKVKSPLCDPSRSVLIVASAVHKSKSAFFVLVLNEEGDLFKLTFEWDAALLQVQRLTLTYFDSVAPSNCFCLTKNGFLVFASDGTGPNAVYQIQKLGEDESRWIYFSDAVDSSQCFFERHAEMKNIFLVDEIESFHLMPSLKIANFMNESEPRLYSCIGKYPRSSLSVLKHGISVVDIASSPLPANPVRIWSLRQTIDAEESSLSLLIISFVASTLVLSFGDIIEEYKQSGFVADVNTIEAFTFADGSFIQVCRNFIRHVKPDKSVVDLPLAQENRSITTATANLHELFVVMDEHEILYFALDQLGDLREMMERKRVPLKILSLSVADPAEGTQRALFLSVGCSDQTCRLVSLNPASWLSMVSLQAFSSPPVSVKLSFMKSSLKTQLQLHVGLLNGFYCRISVDSASGAFVESRTRLVGDGPINLVVGEANGVSGAVLTLSSLTCLVQESKASAMVAISPFNIFSRLDDAAFLSSEQYPEAFAAISNGALKLFAVERFDSVFSKLQDIPLKHSGKRLVFGPKNSASLIAIIESDHRSEMPENVPVVDSVAPIETMHSHLSAEVDEDAMEISSGDSDSDTDALSQPSLNNVAANESEDLNKELHTTQRIISGAPIGKWASRVSFFDPYAVQIKQEIRIQENYVPVSGCFVEFAAYPNHHFFVVGAVQNFVPNPKSFSKCALFLFKQSLESMLFELFHATEIEDVPVALSCFQGMLLASVGSTLRLYDMGKKRMLRKCETKSVPNMITSIHSLGLRVFVGDANSGIFVFQYKVHENQFVLIADDFLPRSVTAFVPLDYDTVAICDKFGDFSVQRLPDALIEFVKQDSTCSRFSEKPWLLGAPHKSNVLCNFHVGEMITSVEKSTLAYGGKECVVYASILGRIGIFAPARTKGEFDVLQRLECALKQKYGDFFGRDHTAHRSNYAPVDGVIDGDLCEMFYKLSIVEKEAIAESIGKTVAEVSLKLDDFRVQFAF